ncbi:MAG: transcription antitermination factor NusB [Candidatus Omnitrophica bacterium]|nr:transcription antitermination factor NusB [Candidatus Omnitrophota bacterium]MDD4013506.1 transcription antitermination factor NusB [Candidatus Omnitrophota bacterium]
MRKRTKARETALMILYAADVTKDGIEECACRHWKGSDPEDPEIKEFADSILNGVLANKAAIDSVISAHATNWEIGRMATIDRNVLRMATYELLYLDDMPPKVAINEAIEMVKKYGDKDSGKFVNGILDKISKTEKKSSKS